MACLPGFLPTAPESEKREPIDSPAVRIRGEHHRLVLAPERLLVAPRFHAARQIEPELALEGRIAGEVGACGRERLVTAFPERGLLVAPCFHSGFRHEAKLVLEEARIGHEVDLRAKDAVPAAVRAHGVVNRDAKAVSRRAVGRDKHDAGGGQLRELAGRESVDARYVKPLAGLKVHVHARGALLDRERSDDLSPLSGREGSRCDDHGGPGFRGVVGSGGASSAPLRAAVAHFVVDVLGALVEVVKRRERRCAYLASERRLVLSIEPAHLLGP